MLECLLFYIEKICLLFALLLINLNHLYNILYALKVSQASVACIELQALHYHFCFHV